jgi:hypothetical protein
MLASCRWIVGRTLLVAFLGGTFVYAKSIEGQQQIPKRSRDNMTMLTIGLHEVGPFYFGGKSHGFTDLIPDPADRVFDVFCSAFDTEWLVPGQSNSTTVIQPLRGPGSKPAIPNRRRYQLRPC